MGALAFWELVQLLRFNTSLNAPAVVEKALKIWTIGLWESLGSKLGIKPTKDTDDGKRLGVSTKRV